MSVQSLKGFEDELCCPLDLGEIDPLGGVAGAVVVLVQGLTRIFFQVRPRYPDGLVTAVFQFNAAIHQRGIAFLGAERSMSM